MPISWCRNIDIKREHCSHASSISQTFLLALLLWLSAAVSYRLEVWTLQLLLFNERKCFDEIFSGSASPPFLLMGEGGFKWYPLRFSSYVWCQLSCSWLFVFIAMLAMSWNGCRFAAITTVANCYHKPIHLHCNINYPSKSHDIWREGDFVLVLICKSVVFLAFACLSFWAFSVFTIFCCWKVRLTPMIFEQFQSP